MPIINMTHSREDAEARGVNVRSCDANGDGKITVWLYNTHVGLCLEDRERNGYEDSDWYMTVWNEAEQKTEEICFASTRGWSYPCYGSSPDATPEVCEKANAYRRRLAVQAAIGNDRAKARIPEAGRLVNVVKGRKVPLGTYRVHHTADDQFRSHGSAMARAWGIAPKPLRCALQPLREDGSVDLSKALLWTADTNCVVLNPEQYETPVAEIEARWANERWYFPRGKGVAA